MGEQELGNIGVCKGKGGEKLVKEWVGIERAMGCAGAAKHCKVISSKGGLRWRRRHAEDEFVLDSNLSGTR